MEHSKPEDDEEEEEFPPFGDSESDYDTVSQPRTSLFEDTFMIDPSYMMISKFNATSEYKQKPYV